VRRLRSVSNSVDDCSARAITVAQNACDSDVVEHVGTVRLDALWHHVVDAAFAGRNTKRVGDAMSSTQLARLSAAVCAAPPTTRPIEAVVNSRHCTTCVRHVGISASTCRPVTGTCVSWTHFLLAVSQLSAHNQTRCSRRRQISLPLSPSVLLTSTRQRRLTPNWCCQLATWRTWRNTRLSFYPFALLYKIWRHPQNWKYKTYRTAVRGGPRDQVTCTENLVKFGLRFFRYASEQTYMLITILHIPTVQSAIYLFYLTSYTDRNDNSSKATK